MRLAAAAVLALAGLPAAAGPAERAEALFYGTGDAGLTVRLAGSEAELPARAFPCANCHGRDGAGGAEGALVVPAIAGTGLSAEDLAAALSEGRGRAGAPLDRTMPRYAADPGVTEALARFLDGLAAREREGLTPETIRIAVPHDARTRGVADRFARGLRAAVRDLHAWGRRIEVTLAEDAISGTAPFLFAGAALGDPDARRRLAEGNTPIFAPLHAVDAATPTLVPLCATRTEQIDALIATLPAGARVAVWPPDEAARAALAGAGHTALAAPEPGGTLLLLSAGAGAAERADGAALVLGLGEELAVRLAPALAAKGASLRLSDACGEVAGGAGRAEALGRLAGLRLAEALARAGRDATRSRVMEELAAGRAATRRAPVVLSFPPGGG